MTTCAHGTCTHPAVIKGVCDTHYAATLAAGRRASRGGAHIIPGVPRDCDCPDWQRPHGTRHGYQYHGCGCDACRLPALEYMRQRRMLAVQGRALRTSAEPVRRRIALLRERGMSVRDIAHAAIVSASGLHQIIRGDNDQVNRDTADRILAIPVPSRKGVAA